MVQFCYFSPIYHSNFLLILLFNTTILCFTTGAHASNVIEDASRDAFLHRGAKDFLRRQRIFATHELLLYPPSSIPQEKGDDDTTLRHVPLSSEAAASGYAFFDDIEGGSSAPDHLQTYSPAQLELILSSFALNDGGSSALAESSSAPTLDTNIRHAAMRESSKFEEIAFNNEHVKTDFNGFVVPVALAEEEIQLTETEVTGKASETESDGSVTR